MLALLLAVMLSIGAINALIPLLIVIILIAAAGASMRGYNIFAIFGISTLAGIGGAKGTLQKKSMARLSSSQRFSGKKPQQVARYGTKKIKEKRELSKKIREGLQTGNADVILKEKDKKSNTFRPNERERIEQNFPTNTAFPEAKQEHKKRHGWLGGVNLVINPNSKLRQLAKAQAQNKPRGTALYNTLTELNVMPEIVEKRLSLLQEAEKKFRSKFDELAQQYKQATTPEEKRRIEKEAKKYYQEYLEETGYSWSLFTKGGRKNIKDAFKLIAEGSIPTIGANADRLVKLYRYKGVLKWGEPNKEDKDKKVSVISASPKNPIQQDLENRDSKKSPEERLNEKANEIAEEGAEKGKENKRR